MLKGLYKSEWDYKVIKIYLGRVEERVGSIFYNIVRDKKIQ